MKRITDFMFRDVNYKLTFVEHQQVKDGVQCDIYAFDGDSNRDLAIVKVDKNNNTPLQRILKGDVTIEGFIEGDARLVVLAVDEARKEYTFTKYGESVEVIIGERMQWQTSAESEMFFFEICTPSYTDGRFENITNDKI